MKLLNQAIKYLSGTMLFIISLWSVIFYFSMLREIKESVDEGLENYKRQIIYKTQIDSTILSKNSFSEGFFTIQSISEQRALTVVDRYIDTLIYMQDADDEALELEPVRLLATAFEKNGRYYSLSIINPMVEEDDLIEELFWEVMLLYIILLASIIIIYNLVLKRLWGPFYDFLNQLKKFRIGSSKNLPVVKTKIKEFIDLQMAVNTLLEHTKETFDQQKQFIGNAAHELQTPLAVVTNKLELLAEKGNLAEDQAESIAEILNIVERLAKLNKSLLLLTKIENKQYLNNQTITLNGLVWQFIEDIEEMAEFKNIKFQVIESANLTAEMDVSLANIIVSNLIINSVFHNIPNGLVYIVISENNLLIKNTGVDIALDPDKIFTRFYKSATTQSGTGLGLSIIKAICGIYGFKIEYSFAEGYHCFDINFKHRHYL